MFLTPSGRFETNTKICLSFSAYHPELWQPAWGIRLILEALISFLPTPADGAIGALDWSSKERQRLATASQRFCCHKCNGQNNNKPCKDLLPVLKKSSADDNNEDDDDDDESSSTTTKKPKTRFAKEIEALQKFQLENEGPNKKKNTKSTTTSSGNNSEEEHPSPSSSPNNNNDNNTQKEETKVNFAEGTKENEEDTKPDDEPASTATPSAPPSDDGTVATKTAIPAAPAVVSPPQQAATATPPPTEEETAARQPPLQDFNPIPDLQQQQQVVHQVVHQNNNNNNNIINGPMAPDDPSWMYDPLLNLMMALLAAICYLLIQKYHDLVEELQELRDYQQ
jgi:hypothetical protein